MQPFRSNLPLNGTVGDHAILSRLRTDRVSTDRALVVIGHADRRSGRGHAVAHPDDYAR